MICNGCLRETAAEGFCYKCRKELFDGALLHPLLPFHSPASESSDRYFDLTKKISISGVQVKYALRIEQGSLTLTDRGGHYILKPVPVGQFRNLDQAPANEHLTMQIAKQVFRMPVAPCAFVKFTDGSPAYLVRRFDVRPDGGKFPQEDFAQVAGITEETHGRNYKYDLSYEELGLLIRKHMSMHMIESEKFFKLILFNYLFSNGDAHARNFSMIRSDAGDYVMSPAYDLLCTHLHSPGESDMALTFFRDGFSKTYESVGFYTRPDFLLLGKKLGIREVRISRMIESMLDKEAQVHALIARSFLRPELKELYKSCFHDRSGRMK